MGSAGWVRFEPTPGAPTTTTPGYTSARPVHRRSRPPQPTQSSAAPSASDTGVPAQVPDEEAGAAGGTAVGLGGPARALDPRGPDPGRRSSLPRPCGSSAAGGAPGPATGTRPTGRSSTPWSTSGSASESSTPRSTLTAVQALVGAGAAARRPRSRARSRRPSPGSCVPSSGSATGPRREALAARAEPTGSPRVASPRAVGWRGHAGRTPGQPPTRRSRPGALAGDVRIVAARAGPPRGVGPAGGGGPGAPLGLHRSARPGRRTGAVRARVSPRGPRAPPWSTGVAAGVGDDSAMTEETFTLRSADGTALHATWWAPVGPPKATRRPRSRPR